MVECNDVNCFVHGSLRTRGSILEGRVVSDKGKRTVIVKRELVRMVPKYERYARSSSRIPAHNPECIGAKLGDLVQIAECRKISRTKAWTVVKVLAHGEAPAVAEKKANTVKAKTEGKGA